MLSHQDIRRRHEADEREREARRREVYDHSTTVEQREASDRAQSPMLKLRIQQREELNNLGAKHRAATLELDRQLDREHAQGRQNDSLSREVLRKADERRSAHLAEQNREMNELIARHQTQRDNLRTDRGGR